MKSLYESILDDEDILIRDAKKYINNPFMQVAITLEKRNGDYRPLERELMESLNKIEMPFDGKWEVDKDFIKFILDSSKSKRKLKRIDCEVIFISNTQAVKNIYKVPDDAKMVVAVIPSDSKFLSKVLKSLKIHAYDNKIDELANQYNLRLHDFEEKIVKTYII
jgi:hypothetical protein